jgi:HD superfamily phosphohydrolase/tRNA A-37 threonylcarbamoyl transferase component Bud32
MNEEFLEKLKKTYLKEDDNSEAFENEQEKLKSILTEIEKEISSNYDFIVPIGRGGSGVVIKLLDRQLKIPRALKFPRPKTDELIESINNEIDNLKNLKQDNIINVYALGEVKSNSVAYPYFVMDYIEDAQDIRKKTKAKLSEISESKELNSITSWLSKKLLEISASLLYCHSQEIVHFDVKPSNILITNDDKAILSDLGLAKKKNDSDKKEVIGFTIFYAHEDLKYGYKHMSSKNLVKREELPKNFKYEWDIYAFGKTILELLALIERKFPEAILYDYIFGYLHLSACRMLDGNNLSNETIEKIAQKLKEDGEEVSVFYENWLELEAKEFESMKYSNFKDIHADLEKLLIDNSFKSEIPELSIYFTKRIQSSDGISAPFSKRVKRIIEHPVFSRLSNVLQLGLVNTIYPTATHNRLEHSIGVFRNCCLYINSLFNDSYNPLFRQLVNVNDIKSLLLASLLHDIGHYPLAHEIEEILPEVKHETVSQKLLNNPTKDKYGNTLQEIIENHDWGWGISVDDIKDILFGQRDTTDFFTKKTLKIKMLSSIIDGPIDIDKVDFLMRDSKNCHLRYGDIIDFERLLSNLTIIIYTDEDKEVNFSVGCYEKGQTAAESLTFARYLLYQSIYWHHTARSIRAMLLQAISNKRNLYKNKRKLLFEDELKKIIGAEKIVKPINLDQILELINQFTDDGSKELIELIQARSYYKRIFTIHYNPSDNGAPNSLLNKFRNAIKKADFNKKLQEKILKEYLDFLSHTHYDKVSLLSPEVTDITIERLKLPNQILCDAPEPSYGTEKNILRFIPEPHRLQRDYKTRKEAGNRVSEVWKQVYNRLMNITAKGRVYCHPEIRDNLMAALGPDDIRKIINKIV